MRESIDLSRVHDPTQTQPKESRKELNATFYSKSGNGANHSVDLAMRFLPCRHLPRGCIHMYACIHS